MPGLSLGEVEAAYLRSIASAYDIPAMLGRAREIEAQLVAAGAVP
jgi:hypothetical protein